PPGRAGRQPTERGGEQRRMQAMGNVRVRLLPSVVGALLLLSACGDSTGPDGGEPASIVVAGGNGQTGAVATALAEPIVAQVRDERGNGVANVSVTFTVTSGGGSVSPAVVVTDANGQAATSWTLGTSTSDEQ